MKKVVAIIAGSAWALPFITFAQSKTTTFAQLVDLLINNIIRPIVPLLIGVAVVVFIYGVITLVFSEGDKKEEGKQYMIWGIVGLFVMVSVWGLVSILINTFQLDPAVIPIKIK